MSRYAPDLSKASAGIPQLTGDFEFAIKDAKQFYRKGEDRVTKEEKEIYGVQYALQITKAEENEKLLGKTIPLQLYFHTEGTEGINKRFVMAALGYALNDEDNFNEKYENANWSFITGDAPEANGKLPEDSVWQQVVGGRVRATCGMKADKNDPSRQNQQFDWKPF
jgi:hypothetical protein